jgi:hypothetical protein
MNNFFVRNKCIFCGSNLDNHLLEQDLENYVGHYAVEKCTSKPHLIPYNVLTCNSCNTPQIKYLGDINEVYKVNHADGVGVTMQQMHEKKLNLILKYKDFVHNIIEIGSSKGILSDLIIKNIETNYYIIEPSYFGNFDGKIIINDYYENVDDSKINADTIIMSHVFEHFYEPNIILEKIKNNSNVKNIFLTFPNFEKYIDEGIFHVLNTEHTFYVDNNFLRILFKKYGFELIEMDFYKSHSVMFYFRRIDNSYDNNSEDILINKNANIKGYFQDVIDTVQYFNTIIDNNPEKEIYLFPSSCHSIFLATFGLKYFNLEGFIDNSPNKIGKNVYGLGTKIFSFKDIVENKKECLILMNGGVFNLEIEHILKSNNIEYYKFK